MEMASSSKDITQEEDENDSCFAFKRQRSAAHLSHSKENNASLLNESVKKAPVEVEEPPIKIVNIRQPISLSPVKAVPVKSSPVKFRIDAIAENLKALQEQKKINAVRVEPTPPKVVSVVAKKSSTDNCTTAPAPLQNKNQLNHKELAHQLILLRCNEKIQLKTKLTNDSVHSKDSTMEEFELAEDLTNLSWLVSFNLSKYPLSPPITPSSSPLSPIQPNSDYQMDDFENDDDEETNGDESDSNFHSSDSINKTPTKWSFISKLIKPWQLPISSGGNSKPNQIGIRPPYSFSCLAFMAIESSQRKRLSFKEIYNWITLNFPYYRSVPSGSWKNSIRHNLANKACFAKVDKNLLAMRDFSGKGSLWCVSQTMRPILVEALLKARHDESQLLNLPQLRDINDQAVSKSTEPQLSKRLGKNKSASSLNSPFTILNPKLLTSKVASKTSPPLPPVITKINAKPGKPGLLSICTSKPNQPPANNGLNELDAVKALLSMKSRASSMPAQSSTSSLVQPHDSTGRRKRAFKPPMKKPYLNPKLFDKESPHFYFHNGEEDEEDDDDEEEEEDEEEEDEEEDEISDNEEDIDAATGKLQVKFPFFNTSVKSNEEVEEEDAQEKEAKVIMTMSDDENSKLEIDESGGAVVESEDSNESNLEPGEIRKSSRKHAHLNRLLELSRAASLVEEVKPQEEHQVKAKKPRLDTSKTPATTSNKRSTRNKTN